eukprot:s325_g19.t1
MPLHLPPCPPAISLPTPMVLGPNSVPVNGSAVTDAASAYAQDWTTRSPRWWTPCLQRWQPRTDPKQNFTSIEELWGVNAAKTTLRELLGMMSTIPDFDTAQPAKTGISKELGRWVSLRTSGTARSSELWRILTSLDGREIG